MTKETLNKIHNMLCSMEAALITDPVHNKGQVIDCISLIKGAIEAECTAPQVTLQPTAIDLIAAESYLERFEPELKKKLESHVLRGQVCSVMKDYLAIHMIQDVTERHEFLKTHLKNKDQ